MLEIADVVELIVDVARRVTGVAHPDDPDELVQLSDVPSTSTLVGLVTRAELTQLETTAIRILLAVELDRDAYRCMQRLASDPTQGAVAIDAVVTVLDALGFDPTEALRAFAGESQLVQCGIVEIHGDAKVPLLVRRVTLHERIVHYLVTGTPGEPETSPWISIEPRCAATELCPIAVRHDARPLVDVLRAQLAWALDGQALWLVGPEGAGSKTALAAVAGEHGLQLLTIAHGDAARVPLRRLISTLWREALIHRAVICIPDVEPTRDGPSAPAEAAITLPGSDAGIAAMYEAMRRAGLPVVFTSRQPPSTLYFEHPPTMIQLAGAAPGDVLELWRRSLPGCDGIEELATRFALPPGRVARVAAEANRLAGAAGRLDVTVADVAQAVGISVARQVEVLGKRIEDTAQWSDLVLPEDTMDRVRELIARVRHRHLVLDAWGFRSKLSKGLGLAALFSGPPGTGKTMMASLIARELGQDLYQIDLSRVVSKWIGETEKNLARVFDAAEGANIVLLFDEADALFARRTEVKSSNDRHANAEVNYLLQRVERFEGICILTTNFAGSIDPAFKRRLAFRLDFPMPEEAERLALWRRMMPHQAMRAGNIDYARLARDYEIAGGNIRNALLRAAFLAASLGREIDMELLARAVELEYRDAGMLAAAGRMS